MYYYGPAYYGYYPAYYLSGSVLLPTVRAWPGGLPAVTGEGLR